MYDQKSMWEQASFFHSKWAPDIAMSEMKGNLHFMYRHAERWFEKVASLAIAILGNSITFFLACLTVIFWLSNKRFRMEDIHYRIGDIILGITFLSLFIIQKSFNRFSASLHLKVNELVVSHESANNTLVNVEEKTELEMTEISKGYAEIAGQAKKDIDTKK
jgi:low affinity Fe/Cu permease